MDTLTTPVSGNTMDQTGFISHLINLNIWCGPIIICMALFPAEGSGFIAEVEQAGIKFRQTRLKRWCLAPIMFMPALPAWASRVTTERSGRS